MQGPRMLHMDLSQEKLKGEQMFTPEFTIEPDGLLHVQYISMIISITPPTVPPELTAVTGQL